MKTFRRKVQKGKQLGRTIGFPTLNLNVGHLAHHHAPGVYLCDVKIGPAWHRGMVHFGSKHNAPHPVLEIYVHDFNRIVYGQWVTFRFGQKIRDVMAFKDLAELQNQLKKDLDFMLPDQGVHS